MTTAFPIFIFIGLLDTLLPLAGAMMTDTTSGNSTSYYMLLPLAGAMMTCRAQVKTLVAAALLPLAGAMMTCRAQVKTLVAAALLPLAGDDDSAPLSAAPGAACCCPSQGR